MSDKDTFEGRDRVLHWIEDMVEALNHYHTTLLEMNTPGCDWDAVEGAHMELFSLGMKYNDVKRTDEDELLVLETNTPKHVGKSVRMSIKFDVLERG